MAGVDIGIFVTAVNNATSSLRGVSEDVKQLGENSEATANRLKAIQVVIAGIVLEKTLELGKAFITASAAVQNIDARMAAWAGSQQKAQSIMQQFNNAVGASGISLETLGNAFVKLRASGIDNDQAVKTIENLANGMAAIGGGDINSNMDAAATAFQRFASKGVVSMRELNMIVRSTGITVGEMSKAMGISVTEFNNELRDKTLSSQQLLDAFNKAAHDKFGDFGQLLSGTVSGSLAKFKTDMELALGHMGENTGASTRIAAVIQAIDQAAQKLIGDISKGDIDKFVNSLLDLVPVAANVIQSIYGIATGVLQIGVMLGTLLGKIPKEATEYGIIGYALFGKVGLVSGALVGALDKGIRTFGDKADDFMIQHNIAPKFFAEDKKKNQVDSLTALMNTVTSVAGPNGSKSGNAWADSFVANVRAMVPKIEEELDKLQHTRLGQNPHLTDAPVNSALDAKRSALQQQVQTMIDQINAKIAEARDAALGDSGAVKIDRMRASAVAVGDAVAKIVDTAKAENAQHGIAIQHLGQLVALAHQFSDAMQVEIAHQQVLNDLSDKKLKIEQSIKMASADKEIAAFQKQVNINTDPMASFTEGFKGGDSAALKEQVDAIQEKIQQYNLVINEAQTAIANNQNNPAIVDAANQTIAKYQQLISVAQTAASTMNTTSRITATAFKELGQTLNNDIAGGLSKVIQGTESWRQLGTQLFSSMINWAIKYMLQLVEMQVMGEAMQAASVTASAPMAAAQASIWSPAAIAASIATFGAADAVGVSAFQAAMMSSMVGFADGGVFQGRITPGGGGSMVTGPTMFGVMGEAGHEAIMPLTRVGGKLGVHAAGMASNGDTHIHINAIDTQSGLDFLGKHLDHIGAGLAQRSQMNGRAGRF